MLNVFPSFILNVKEEDAAGQQRTTSNIHDAVSFDLNQT